MCTCWVDFCILTYTRKISGSFFYTMCVFTSASCVLYPRTLLIQVLALIQQETYWHLLAFRKLLSGSETQTGEGFVQIFNTYYQFIVALYSYWTQRVWKRHISTILCGEGYFSEVALNLSTLQVPIKAEEPSLAITWIFLCVLWSTLSIWSFPITMWLFHAVHNRPNSLKKIYQAFFLYGIFIGNVQVQIID